MGTALTKTKLRVFLLCVFAMVLAATLAFACSCVIIEPLTAEQLKGDGLVLFIGKAVTVEPIPSGDSEADRHFVAGSRTTFAVERHWVAELRSELVVESGVPGGCGFLFESGKEYLVFATRGEDRTLTTSICTRTTLLERATKLVSEIERLIGKSKIPEPPVGQQLFEHLQCDAHVITTWRHLEARAFRGRVELTPEADKFPGALVALRAHGSDTIHKTETDQHGRFRIDGLKDGLYEFVACASGMDPDMGWIMITPDTDVQDVVLNPRLGI